MNTSTPLTFAIFGNEYQIHKSASISKILGCLEKHEADVCIDKAFYDFLVKRQLIDLPDVRVFSDSQFDADFVISMGGDGTLLKAASRVGDKQIPIIGVNMGRLGFLAGVMPCDIEDMVNDIFNGEYVLDRVKFWNIPNDDLDEVRRVWARTVQTIREGVQLIQTPRGISNNLPKQAESPVAHVRPHGKDASDKLPLPDGRMMTKQCFWLNNTYIAEQIKEK